MAEGQNTDAAIDNLVDQPADSASDNTGKSPEWDGDFDKDRAARLVANLREESKKAKEELAAIRSKLSEKEDAEKTEYQRLTERAERAERELESTKTTLMVAEVAKEYGVPADLLSGSSREEIEARAKALAEFAGSLKKPAEDVPSKPKPRLIPGQGAEAITEDVDVAALAARIRKNTY